MRDNQWSKTLIPIIFPTNRYVTFLSSCIGSPDGCKRITEETMNHFLEPFSLEVYRIDYSKVGGISLVALINLDGFLFQ